MSIEVGKVAMVDISNIDIGDRTRVEMGDLISLEESMKNSGLIAPLAVKEIDDNKYLLLAGERRLRTLLKNKVEIIPVRIFPSSLSDLEIKIIEKSENFHRKDMEFWEFDNLTREIHELQQSIHGTKAPGPDAVGWGTDDTGKLIGVSKASVSTAIKRAEAREAFPELFDKCKTQKDASTVIKKMDELVVKEVIAQKIQLETTSNSFTKLSNCFVLNDFFEGVKKIPDSVYHLVEIDPPYAIRLQQAKKTDGESIYSSDSYNEIDADKYIEFLSLLFQECYRVMAQHSWLICWFAPQPWIEVVYKELTHAGFNTTRMCGVWTKGYGQSKRPEIHLANSYEMFFYAWKGRPALNKPGRRNIFDYPPVPPQKKTHPTERPIELMKEIYNTFAFPGSRVLIPFLGSGNGILAADQLGMSPLGFELSKAYRDSFLIKLHSQQIV